MFLMCCSEDTVSVEVRDKDNVVMFASYGNDYDGLEASPEDITRFSGRSAIRGMDFLSVLFSQLR